jgi:predicted nucleotidyltransferase
MFKVNKEIERALYALGEQLEHEDIAHLEIMVCGAAALFNLQWHIRDRSTEDIDILAFVDINENGLRVLRQNSPLWKNIQNAARRVARDFDLKSDWLNRGAVFLTEMGLPEGILERADLHQFGKHLTIHFIGRQDIISLKLFAYLNDVRRSDVHADDLFELNPTNEEMEQASLWCVKINSSVDFKKRLKSGLIRLGYNNVTERI